MTTRPTTAMLEKVSHRPRRMERMGLPVETLIDRMTRMTKGESGQMLDREADIPRAREYFHDMAQKLRDPEWAERLAADEEGAEIIDRLNADTARMLAIVSFLNRGARNAKKYGISLAAYNGLMEDQNGACAICSREFAPELPPVIDHNHETKAVRGLLCAGCNTGLGQFQDSPDLLAAALDYLDERGCYGANVADEEPG